VVTEGVVSPGGCGGGRGGSFITGFTPLPGRWLRWKMLCRATFTIVQLTGAVTLAELVG
jgi:hypothetical protein